MAAATVSASSTIDLKNQATFPIRLGSSISDTKEQSKYTSVRYNHKPSLSSSDTIKARIQDDSEAGKSKLTINAQDGEYGYSGQYGHHGGTFVLVVRGASKEKELVLERVHSNHRFNLIRTPAEADASNLASLYPHLQDDASEDDLFGDDEEDMPADDTNPFDYRHFLKDAFDKPESTNANLDATRSAAQTPVVKPKPFTDSTSSNVKLPKRTETKSAPPKKRKVPPTTKTKPNPKRVKAGQESPPSAPTVESSKLKSRPEVPKISLDRKASLRRPSMDDSGELILENETPVTEKPPRNNAMARALNGQLGTGSLRTGPISLQSAANSPASHVASPAPVRPDDGPEENEYVFEFDDEPEPENQQGGDDADVEEEVDGDVEDLELPSPAQAQRPSLTGQSNTGAADEDDDLDQQLAAAMMEEDQESEESEEE